MNLHRSLVTALTLAIGFAAAAPAIADSDTTVTVTKHHYVYYGEHQIYFAPETKTYYWQTTSTGPWQSGAVLPVESQGYVTSGGVEMDLDTDHPYERNEWVVGHYKHMHDNNDKHEHDQH